MEGENSGETSLRISASIGFNRASNYSIVIHPSDMHFMWAQGRLLVIKSIGLSQNTYLQGHEGEICSIACSKSGNLVATGEKLAYN